jgi:hypothetical protein
MMAGANDRAVIRDITEIERTMLSLADLADAYARETAIRPMISADAAAMADALRAVWRVMSRHAPASPVTGATGTDG